MKTKCSDQGAERETLDKVANQLVKAGACLPLPYDATDLQNGLSIALLIVMNMIEELDPRTESTKEK